MFRARTFGVVVIMLVLISGTVGVSAELSSEHSLDITGSVDIPTRTVETKWGEATITELGKEESGDTLEVSTSVPNGESYVIRIVNNEERNLESEFVTGDVERDFVLDRFEPGTYVVALTNSSGDNAFEVEPFIIKGYEIDQSTTDVTKGEKISISIQLTQVNDRASDPQVVNTTLSGSGTTRSVEATSTGENSYQANFSTNGLSTGSYEIYIGIETNNDIFGVDELIGFSETSVTVQESTPTPTATSTPTQTSTETPESTDEPDETSAPAGGGGGVGGSETATTTSTGNTQSPSSVSTSKSTSTSESEQSDEVEATGTEAQRQTPESTAVETAPEPSETEAGTESATTSSEMPLFSSSILIVLTSILVGVMYRLWRSD